MARHVTGVSHADAHSGRQDGRQGHLAGQGTTNAANSSWKPQGALSRVAMSDDAGHPHGHDVRGRRGWVGRLGIDPHSQRINGVTGDMAGTLDEEAVNRAAWLSERSVRRPIGPSGMRPAG